jgi:phenylpropionate dioxygenase-like ring-hydroxylating dioxygenase large terminal subunit
MINDSVLLNDWHPVASISELENKHMIDARLLGEDIVIWRAGKEIIAWQDLCVHRGTKLSLGKVLDGERVQCPYHGWVYNRTGRCVHIPAMSGHEPPERARVKTYRAQARYGWVWVCLGEPANAIPPFPEWEKADFRKILCGPYQIQASGPRIVENFLDVAHFPYVHENILGTQSHTEIEEYDVEIGPEGVEATNVRVYQPDPYGTGQGDTVAYTYRVYRPLTAYLLKESAGPKFSILLSITPHGPTESSAWLWMAMNYGHDIPEKELIDWQDQIFAQDRPIVQSQRPELLPLDLQAELNMRCDRTAVSYRRWLRELGLTFGVA